MTESLTLKWGTLKAWELNPDGPAMEALRRYHEEQTKLSAMMQRDTESQKRAICDIIDSLDAETVFLDWDGKDVTKDEAKKYVLEYGQ